MGQDKTRIACYQDRWREGRKYEHPNSVPQQVVAQRFHLNPAPALSRMVHSMNSPPQRERLRLQVSWGAAHAEFRSSVVYGGADDGDAAAAAAVVAVVVAAAAMKVVVAQRSQVGEVGVGLGRDSMPRSVGASAGARGHVVL